MSSADRLPTPRRVQRPQPGRRVRARWAARPRRVRKATGPGGIQVALKFVRLGGEKRVSGGE